MAVQDSPSLIVLIVSDDVKPNSERTPYVTAELILSCVKVEVAVQGSPLLIVLMVSVDESNTKVKSDVPQSLQHCTAENEKDMISTPRPMTNAMI